MHTESLDAPHPKRVYKSSRLGVLGCTAVYVFRPALGGGRRVRCLIRLVSSGGPGRFMASVPNTVPQGSIRLSGGQCVCQVRVWLVH